MKVIFTKLKMASKILVGAGMLMPAFALQTYEISKGEVPCDPESIGSLTNSAVECGKTWLKWSAVIGVIGLAYLGMFHIGFGVNELSPKLCPRE